MANRELVVTRNDNHVTVVLPMLSPYVPIPSSLIAADMLAIVLVPLWAIGSAIVRTVFRIPSPPRAFFEIDAERFRMTLVSQDNGEKSHIEYARDDIVELRKNRYEKGLWLHVRGAAMQTYLQDVDDDTIVSLSTTLRNVLGHGDDKIAIDQSTKAGNPQKDTKSQ